MILGYDSGNRGNSGGGWQDRSGGGGGGGGYGYVSNYLCIYIYAMSWETNVPKIIQNIWHFKCKGFNYDQKTCKTRLK